MEDTKKNIKKYIIAGIIVGVLLLTGGVTYALWQITHAGEKTNKIVSGCFEMEFVQLTNSVSLRNAYPISDAKGLKTDPYTFTIKNNCTIYGEYIVTLDIVDTTTDINLDKVKMSLDGAKTVEPTILTTLNTNEDIVDFGDGTVIRESYILASDKAVVGNSEKTYNFRMWIDESATTSVEDGVMGKGIEARITIVSVAKKAPAGIIVDKNENMIAIMWDGTNWVKADESNSDATYKWYDYENQQWANSILVKETGTKTREEYKTSTAGTPIDESDILAYYVYIPRYKYQLWNAENGNSDPQEIKIEFQNVNVPKESGSTNGEWLTHPAFTFGDEELNGIWVGKFETSADSSTTCFTNPSEANCDKANGTITPRIKPNVDSWRFINLGRIFDVVQYFKTNPIYGINQSNIDSHMMKNMEWGAVAYLSHSKYGKYGSEVYTGAEKDIYINNVRGASPQYKVVTGCSGGSPTAAVVTTCSATNTYEKSGVGTGASTTGTIYGVYDMSGGAYEYTMGNMRNDQGQFYPSGAVFSTTPETKYYDSYAYDASNYFSHGRGLLGDATRETLVAFGESTGTSGWYSDFSHLPNATYAWFQRGGYAAYGANAGAFGFDFITGVANAYSGFRSVVVSITP